MSQGTLAILAATAALAAMLFAAAGGWLVGAARDEVTRARIPAIAFAAVALLLLGGGAGLSLSRPGGLTPGAAWLSIVAVGAYVVAILLLTRLPAAYRRAAYGTGLVLATGALALVGAPPLAALVVVLPSTLTLVQELATPHHQAGCEAFGVTFLIMADVAATVFLLPALVALGASAAVAWLAGRAWRRPGVPGQPLVGNRWSGPVVILAAVVAAGVFLRALVLLQASGLR